MTIPKPPIESRRPPLKIMKRVVAAVSFLGAMMLVVTGTSADEPKNHDFDVIRDEASVPPYRLPPILVSAEGKLITMPEEWFNVRRRQIMALFGNLIYGVVPAPATPVRTTFEVVKTDRDYMSGKATRKDVRIRFANAQGSAGMTILVFTPSADGKTHTRVPAAQLWRHQGRRPRREP